RSGRSDWVAPTTCSIRTRRPVSSAISRARAASIGSPGSHLPPGRSHRPGLFREPAERLPARQVCRSSRTIALTDSANGFWVMVRSPPRGPGRPGGAAPAGWVGSARLLPLLDAIAQRHDGLESLDGHGAVVLLLRFGQVGVRHQAGVLLAGVVAPRPVGPAV